MKLARLNNLARLDTLFIDGETDEHYDNRMVSVVDDSYDFNANDATELTSVTDWFTHRGKCININHCIEHMQESITDWANHDSGEKELFLTICISAFNPLLSASQMADIEYMAYIGFTVYQNGGVNTLKTWNGSTWQ